MRLSVVIPFYRELDLIGRAVESVLQNAEAVEGLQILVCNDGPIPAAEVLARLSEEGRKVTSVVMNAGPKGPGGARNTGLNLAQGEVIAFLDADDFWLPGKVATQVAEVRKGASFVATAYAFEGSDVVIQPPASLGRSLDMFLKRGIGTSTVLITRQLLQSHRFRDIRFSQDIDYWYVLSQSPHFRYAPVTNSSVVYSTGGATKNKWVQLQYFHRVLALNKVPLVPRGRILASYVLAGIYNHYVRRHSVGAGR